MQSLVSSALELADKGFYVFPLIAGTKLPAIKNFPELATRDSETIKNWWQKSPYNNVGISTSRYNGEGEFLVGVDIDVKKDGYATLEKLKKDGIEFPKTFEQVTPTGGRHLIYKTKHQLKQGVDILGAGVDTRSKGGYLVGMGSVIDGKPYKAYKVEVAEITESLLNKLTKTNPKKPIETKAVKVEQERALKRVQHYLENEAPLAIQGEAGDQTTFQVACRVKDYGLAVENAVYAMEIYWNDRCSPPWELLDLQSKVENAYRYGQDFAGSKAPEVLFDKIENNKNDLRHPVLELNKEYAFIIIKGKSFVLHETKDGNEYLTTHSFKEKLLPKTILYNDKKHQITDLWLRSPERRSYDGICFMPGQDAPENLYNLWKGFKFEPSDDVSDAAKEAVNLFLDHTLENICDGDPELFAWLIGYFAHLIQSPWDKPVVAPVFKGGKGVGKNSFIEVIGELLNGHYTLASDSRYLLGNFNSHLENCLLFVLDEAFWSGDKKAEGRLKDIITGKTHLIERKGSEAYSVKNCTRVVIIGNEEWMIPASYDERRFAVFNVGSKARNNFQLFKKIHSGMRAGGYQFLLKYLMEFNLDGIDINMAPQTAGLADQKVRSLNPFHEWWYECLKEGRIVNGDFSQDWDKEISKDSFRFAYRRFVKERNINSRGETPNQIGVLLRQCLPAVHDAKKQLEGIRVNTYILPDLAACRKAWDFFIGHKFIWK